MRGHMLIIPLKFPKNRIALRAIVLIPSDYLSWKEGLVNFASPSSDSVLDVLRGRLHAGEDAATPVALIVNYV